MIDLTGQTVAITGAAQGVGLAIARACADEGMNVALIGSAQSKSKMESLIASLKDSTENDNIAFYQVDLLSEESIKQVLETIYDEFEALDVLINNASVILPGKVQNVITEHYDLMHQINMRAPYILSKAAAPLMIQSAQTLEGVVPQIINIAPPLNLDPKCLGQFLPYTSSRYMLSMYTIGMAEEFKNQITVNALWPKCPIDANDSCDIIAGTYEKIDSGKRHPNIMAHSVIKLLMYADYEKTGEFVIDEELLKEFQEDVSVYQNKDDTLQKETFC